MISTCRMHARTAVRLLAWLGCVVGCQADVIDARDERWQLTTDLGAFDLEDVSDSGLTPPKDIPDVLDMGARCPPLERETCVVSRGMSSSSCSDEPGVFFDGTTCQYTTECACNDSKTCVEFDSMESCATTCGREGVCHKEVLSWGTFFLEQCLDIECREGVSMCIRSEQDPTLTLKQRLPERLAIWCTPPTPHSICNGQGNDCSQDWCCHAEPDDGLEQRPDLQALCSLSLHSDVRGIHCINLE